MNGDCSNNDSLSWENDPHAGIIPRAMHQLFSHLELQASTDVIFLMIHWGGGDVFILLFYHIS